MSLRDLVLDRWAELSFKAGLASDNTNTSFRSGLAPTWVGDHARRLSAYKALAAYLSNNARHFLPDTIPEAEKSKRREYGEPDLIVERVVAGVLGDQVELVVEGADDDVPEVPQLPPEPQDPGPDASETDRIVFEATSRVWREESAAAVAAWEQARRVVPALRDRQDWLRQWADDELLEAKLWEGERDTVGLADGVYVLGWSASARRPVLQVYDPGHYFPVLTDTDRGYPRKVHLAWEFEEDRPGTSGRMEAKRFVRRITWELVSLDTVFAPTGADDTAAAPVRSRRYPWQAAGETASTTTCVMTDATWPLDALGERKVDDFGAVGATYATNEEGLELNRLDLKIDFIPVVHVPDTPSSKEHFGRSVLARVLQLFDDIQASDTDRQAAAALAAGPVLGMSGDKVVSSDTKVRPGLILNLGTNGKLDVLDLSRSVDALGKLVADLLDRLFVNVQVPAEVLGRVDSSVQIAGITVALRFGPFEQLVRVLRLVREPKGRLIVKFVQRLAQAGGVLPAGENPPARIAFGSFLPSDRTAAAELVVKLLAAHGISRRTALQMLVEAGVDIGDLAEELERVEHEDFAGARELADALNDEGPAYDYLGREQPDRPEPPPAPTPPSPTPPAPTP